MRCQKFDSTAVFETNKGTIKAKVYLGISAGLGDSSTIKTTYFLRVFPFTEYYRYITGCVTFIASFPAKNEWKSNTYLISAGGYCIVLEITFFCN